VTVEVQLAATAAVEMHDSSIGIASVAAGASATATLVPSLDCYCNTNP